MTRAILAARPQGWRVSDAIIDDAGRVISWVSVLDPRHDSAPAEGWGSEALVLFSGRGESTDRPAWMPGSRERLESFLQKIAPFRGDTWLCPRHDHALSDIPGVLTFLRSHERLGLLLDPIAMLAPSMLGQAEDHLARIFEALGAHPQTRAVLLTNIAPGSEVEGVRVAPLHRGVVRPKLLVELWREHCRPEAPVVLIDEKLTEQRHALER